MSTEIKVKPRSISDKKSAVIEPPPLYKVIMLNDDYTPMEFVVEILVKFFSLNEDKAVKTMLKIHHEGRAICGIYPRDIAQTKVDIVYRYIREHKQPLICFMEEDK